MPEKKRSRDGKDQSSNWYVLSLTSWFCILEMFISIYRNICTILNARTLTARRRKLDVTKESSCAYVTNKFHSGKLCSAPPTKFSPYADADNCQFWWSRFSTSQLATITLFSVLLNYFFVLASVHVYLDTLSPVFLELGRLMLSVCLTKIRLLYC